MDAAATTSGRAVDCDDDPVPVRDEGYVDALVRASLHLIRKDFPHDVRGHGVRLIQHLVRFRWEELSITNWSKFVDVVSFLGVELRVPDDLVWKNATAHLVAEVVWSHGISLLHDLIPCFVCLSAKGATETELVCLILRSISDTGSAHGSCFGGDKPKLFGLSEFLPWILPFISALLEKHSGAVSGENLNHQVEVTTQHACAVKAALDAANAYAQWVDVIDLAKHGLIKGCGRILICNDFHVHAMHFFNILFQRIRSVGIAVADSDFVVRQLVSILLNNSQDTLECIEDCLSHPHTTLSYNVAALRGALCNTASPKDTCTSSESRYSSKSKINTLIVMSSPDTSSGIQGMELLSSITLNAQLDDNDCDLELQRPMTIGIFDTDKYYDGDCAHAGHGNYSRDNILEDSEPRMLGNDGARQANSFHQVGCLLLAEHNIISEAFCTASSWSRIQRYKDVLTCILSPLSKIWTQPEWEGKYTHYAWCLTHLFSDRRFVKNVYDVVKSWEEQFKRRVDESHVIQIPDKYSDSLLQLILPLLLQFLRCVHALWNQEITFDLSEELTKAKRSGIDEEEGSQEIEMRQWLQDIRESGYNIIGLCASLRGMLFEYTDSSQIYDAILEDLGSMEFRHLSKLIHLVFIPLVRNCPYKSWNIWTVNLLRPLLLHFEDVLECVWSNMLHHGRAKAPYYFGNLHGSLELVTKLEEAILLEFTREVCDLLGVLALPELNKGLLQNNLEAMASYQNMESESTGSLVRYLFLHDCFGRLRMSFFGYLVDGEAAMKAIPFCHALVHLARAANDDKLRVFISSELLPCLIRHIDDQLPCAIGYLVQKLNTFPNDDAIKKITSLCGEAYNYLSSHIYAQSQDSVKKEKESEDVADSFKCWLVKQKEDLRAKAYSAPPKEFFEQTQLEWNWEFQDEFRRYLPVYFEMMQEVDAMVGCLEVDYLYREVLYMKLRPEFRSKYAIDSSEHPHLKIISNMRERKYYSMVSAKHHKQIYAILGDLITLKPYIKGSDHSYEIVERIGEKFEIPSNIFDCDDAEKSIHILLSVLRLWEPQFHPLIREGHKDFLLEIVRQLAKAKAAEYSEPFVPQMEDFKPHLQPYAAAFFEATLKDSMYDNAKVQVHLHEEFDSYLSSGELDGHLQQSLKDIDAAVPSPFSILQKDLIDLSLKRRIEIVSIHHQVLTYSKCLRCLLENESLKDEVKSLMSELEAEGFFDVDDKQIEWEKKYFSESIDRFNDKVFAGHSLPRHYVIRGIMDYRTILFWKANSWEDAFDKVVVQVCGKLISFLPQLWSDTRYYDHQYYDIIREPFKQMLV